MTEAWMDVDQALDEAIESWHHARTRLRNGVADGRLAPPAPSVPTARLAALTHADTAGARTRVAWLHALHAARGRWPALVTSASMWSRKQALPDGSQRASLRELRVAVLTARDTGPRAESARAFVAASRPLHAHALAGVLASAMDPATSGLGVAGLAAPAVRDAALRWLDRTDDAAQEWQRCGWVEGLGAALGRRASDGWPPRPSHRWVHSVFQGTDMLARVTRPPPLPAAWGGSSFARALGALGEAALLSARPAGIPLALHLQPFGVRRHQRRALFGAVTLLESFASRVLRLGHRRAREHQREMAAAALASLRLDAARVVLWGAAHQGSEALRERHVTLTRRLFGQAAPPTTLAVFPQLWPTDGARLIGAIHAAQQLTKLIAQFNDDWFRNPRAAPALAAVDERAEARAPVAAEPLTNDTEHAAALLEALLG